ncbi:MAG TPA: VOC family protein [Blastocatellia bacterium]|jgi:catechol 2,3-dioxygenase-like lactoylglutathione lyase family enzyme|nr:VOC family protein [Blastocatellia bacterium]
MIDLPLDHIAVVSRNMDADLGFYSRLGFTVETRYEDWVMLRDGAGRGVALLLPGGKHPPHIALKAPSLEILETLAREHNGRVNGHRDGSVSAYVTDASGNALEIVFYPSEEK